MQLLAKTFTLNGKKDGKKTENNIEWSTKKE